MTTATAGLRNIKGLGPTKARMIQKFIDDGNEVSVESLSGINGVSRALAQRIVAYVETHSEPEPEPTEPEAAPEPEAPEGNGHTTRTAGEVRRFAREVESFGYADIAEELRTSVRALLDDETVTL